MLKKIIKVMAYVSLCLSMMVPSSVFAYEVAPYPNDFTVYSNSRDLPYTLRIGYRLTNVYISGSGTILDYVDSEYTFYTDAPITFQNGNIEAPFCDYTKYDIRLRKVNSDGRIVYDGHGYDDGNGLNTFNSCFKNMGVTFDDVKIYSNYDLLDNNGNVIHTGDSSDTPPQPDVPTDTSWSEILASAFLPMILAVIGGMALWMLCSRLLKLLRTLCNRYLRG